MVEPERALLVARLRRVAPLSAAAEAAFLAIVQRRSFAEGEWLLRAGEPASWCFSLVSGLARELYVSDEGAEHTRTFIERGGITGSLLDLLSGEPSVTWIQALAPTVTLAWRYRELDALASRFIDLQVQLRRSAEAVYVRKARREHELLALGAKERYLRWLRDHPGLDAVVSRRHLASYLGVTPEHLSRLGRAVRRTRAPSARARRENS